MTNCPVVQIDYFSTFEGEVLFNPESDHLRCSYVRLPNAEAASLRTVGGLALGGRSLRTVVRRGLTGLASARPKRGSRFAMHARAAIALIAIGALASGCTDAEAASKSTKAASKTKTNREAQGVHSSAHNSQAGDHHLGHDDTADHDNANVVDRSAGGAVGLRGVLGRVRHRGE